jgi:DNA helicase HerA-like ATPase
MLDLSGNCLIAKSDRELFLIPGMANRHGLIAGATGTGKTVSLQVVAETFSAMGVPSFLADVKGDLSGLGKAGLNNPKVEARVMEMKLTGFTPQASPVCFWDLYGEKGHPLRTTISEMGPMLLSRILNLNEVQSGVMNLLFRIADDNGLLLLDLKDLRKMLEFAGENRDAFTSEYGNLSPASIGTIQRGLLVMEEHGVEKFFGEPAVDLMDFIQTDSHGRGMVNILAADKLMQSPLLYSTFLLWLLSELFEQLPETGDPVKPKLVFFFDEAHLLFNEAPKALLEKIEQVVRLIRSKGVGVYFITQNPLDIPDTVLGQLGNRIQHAIRAYTPKDLKAVKAAAETFRANPSVSVEETITQLGVGEALVSFLDEKGVPSMVERAKILPPQSQIGALTEDERKQIIQRSPVFGAYEKVVDRESAFEILQKRMQEQEARKQMQELEQRRMKEEQKMTRSRSRGKSATAGTILEDITKYAGRTVTRQIGTTIGRQIVRGILGSLLKS